MKIYKKVLCFLLVFAISLIMFSGCGVKSDGGINEKGFFAGVKARDDIEMFDYKAIPVPSDIHNIPDDQVQSEIKAILAEYALEKQIKDRAVQDGDKVNIDYVGSVDGVEFAGGSTQGKGAEVTAGSTDYIDDFLTQIIGHMPGETINVEVTFPENYGKEDLNGKDALFVTTINYIIESLEPELTDVFVAKNLTAKYGWKTAQEMKDEIKSDLQKKAVRQYIWEYFATEVKLKKPVPESLIKFQEQERINYYQRTADSYGMELDAFLNTAMGFSSTEEMLEHFKDANLKEATCLLVIQAIAEDMKFTLSDQDIADYFLENTGSADYSSFVEQYGLPYIKHIIMQEQVLEYVVENAVLK